ncbi:MAG: SPOR domain-containing protein [SAR86 cluster bacterium]|jgi:hypothetical protein|tara:strand:- start:16789 stop:17628 length:840 start_codon:yes stop_codon:yes gene_type:complete
MSKVGGWWRNALVLSLLLVSAGVQALDNYWVVGSFAREGNASREAERLGRVTGLDVSYKVFQSTGAIYYRVVTRASLSPDALLALRRELAKTGVTDLWLTSLGAEVQSPIATVAESRSQAVVTEAGNAPLSTADVDRGGRYYLVVESTTDVDAAVALELKLNKSFGGVSSMTVLAEGDVQHRVVIGPATLVALDPVAARLQETGYTGTWLMPYDSSSMAPSTTEPLLLEGASQRVVDGDSIPGSPNDGPALNNSATATVDACGRPYNLARLTRDCQSSL